MSVYYNDSNAFVCAWLRNLIAAGHLPDGDVDERRIEEVQSADLRGFTQCHFFAGIGGWAYALRLARWPGDRSVWTGSCPCQPFSAAGAHKSHTDARHLWPAWFNLIHECRPLTIFGEQVSSAAGLGWLDAVALDLETVDYAVGACVLGAHSVGAPHKRQRLYFVAQSEGWRNDGALRDHEREAIREVVGSGIAHIMADRDGARRGPGGPRETGDGRDAARIESAGLRDAGELADTDGGKPSDGGIQRSGEYRLKPQDGSLGGMGVTDSGGSSAGSEATAPDRYRHSPLTAGWDACDWLPCRDGKARPVEPGTFPLAHGIPSRVGRLRAYGNAIIPQVAAAFVKAYMECMP